MSALYSGLTSFVDAFAALFAFLPPEFASLISAFLLIALSFFVVKLGVMIVGMFF